MTMVTTSSVVALLHERALTWHRRLFGIDCTVCHGGSAYPCGTCRSEVTELSLLLDEVARDAIAATCRAYEKLTGTTPKES